MADAGIHHERRTVTGTAIGATAVVTWASG